MEIKYYLKKDIVSRTAANLVFSLSEAKSVFIIKEKKSFNGKSLIGVLTNKLQYGDTITIKTDFVEDIKIIKEAFDSLGVVIN